MKTATKFLSMLLLVAMCLSLMGGSAYALSLEPTSEPAGDSLSLEQPAEDSSIVPAEGGALDLTVGGTEPAQEDSGNTLDLEIEDVPSKLNAEDLIWNGYYRNLDEAAKNTVDIKLHDAVTDNPAKDPGGTITRSVTIDLNKKSLAFDGPMVVNANITIKNGTLTNPEMITVGKGYKITTTDVNMSGKDFSGEGGSSVTKAYVATIGSEKFADMDSAFAYAAQQTGTVTINVIDDPSVLKDHEITNLPSAMNCSAIVLNLGKNCLKGALSVPTSLTVNGGKIDGTVGVAFGNVTLNNTEVTDMVSVAGKTLTVNSSKVASVILTGGTLSMGAGSEISALEVQAGTQSILKVSGGVVKKFTAPTGLSAYRAVTGGEWTVADDASLDYLRNSVADGMSLKGTSNPYTVGAGAGTGGGDSGVVTGNFTIYGSPYTKGSGNTVYVMMPYTSSTGSYYYSTVSNPTTTSQISTIASAYCSVTSSGSQYRLTLGNGFLDSLSAGTIYLWTGHDGKYTSMGSLTITGSSTPIIPGTASVWPVDDTWYSGTGMFYFYVTPDLQLVDGVQYDYYDVVIDGMQIGGDKISYNGYQKFGIAASVMDTLATGYHKIEVRTTAGWATGSFRVGATLRAVDTDKHVTGSSRNLQFVCSDSISRVWVGNNELTSYNYSDYWTLSSSGKTVTLTPKFLNSQLVAGNTYTITVQTANGDRPSCNFQILTTAQASSSPRTGDESNLALWAALLVLAGGATVAILPRLKKNED